MRPDGNLCKIIKATEGKNYFQVNIILISIYDFWIVVAFIDVISAQFIALNIGRKRKIGYGKSIFWSIVLGPLVGLIITLSSKKLE